MDQSSKKGLGFGIVVGVVLIAVAAAVIKYTFMKEEVATTTEEVQPSPTISTTVESPEATPVSSPTSNSTYKDGSYTATGNYISPGGPESVTVKLTLKNDVVTDATVTSNASLPASKQFQQQFISGYKAQVIGKNISSIQLDKVSGSSLTPKGFNDAVAKIKVQADA